MKTNKLIAFISVISVQATILVGQDLLITTPRVSVASEFTLGNFPQVPEDPSSGAKILTDTDSSPKDATAKATEAKSASDKSDSSKNDDAEKKDSKGDKDDGKKEEKKDDKKEDKDKDKKDDKKDDKKKDEKKWYDKIGMRGYVQFRYNYATTTDDDSAPRQHAGDSSISDRNEFFIRRARLIFFGDIGEHLYLYVQPDLASTPNGAVDQVQFAQIRDCYGDIYVDKGKIHRFRVGQSKIPYGWENLQSSSNRLTLDRADSFNSAARNERDVGVFYYWTPKWGQDFFKAVNDEGLKGSGNYGIFALGAYNGQGGSLREQNDTLHLISRFTMPIHTVWNKRWEAGVQAYTGEYVVLGERISPLGIGAAAVPTGTRDLGGRDGFLDQRVGWTIIKYPEPFGMQAEYTIGKTPQLNAAQTGLEPGEMHGGYWMAYYRYKTLCNGEFWPYVRYQYHRGGYRSAANSPYAEINEWNFGVEWQIKKEFELVTEYLITDRTNLQAFSSGRSYDQYNGHLLRFQFQMNF